jgi:hypothetical protein
VAQQNPGKGTGDDWSGAGSPDVGGRPSLGVLFRLWGVERRGLSRGPQPIRQTRAPNRTVFSASSTFQRASGTEVDDRIESMPTASSQRQRGRQDHKDI